MSQPTLQYLRGTGRTTRMLEAAIQEARERPEVPVFVVAANLSHCRELFLQCIAQLERSLGGPAGPHPGAFYAVQDRITLRNGGTVFFTTPWSIQFNWQMCDSEAGYDPRPVIFVDHYAIEQAFPKMLEMLHRFDL